MSVSEHIIVSVVIPVLDDAMELRACLAHLARQDRPADEVVVVDNGCRDDSAAIALAAGARVVREDRRGIMPAVAAGFDAAVGDILLRCDADCRPHPDWVRRMSSRLAADPHLVGVTGPGSFLDLPGVRGRLAWGVYAAGYFGGMGAAAGRLPLWGSNCALRRSAWEEVSATVHRDDPFVHDDLDITMAFGPGDRIGWEPRTRMPVAGRAFTSRAAFARRVAMGRHTLRRNWPGRGPGDRWVERFRG